MVKSAKPSDYILVFGDFNLPSVSWKYPPDSSNLVPLSSNDFLNHIMDLGLHQINAIFNINNKLLDLVFTNEPTDCTISRSSPITKPEDFHHPTLLVCCSLMLPVLSAPIGENEEVFCFKRANYKMFNRYLANMDWNTMLSIGNGSPSNIELMINTFYTCVYSLMENCIPKSTVYSFSGPPWGSKQLSYLKNKKNKLYKKYRKSNNITDYGRYSICRAEFNMLNTTLYKNYLIKIRSSFKENPKAFYKFVNSKRKSHEFPSVMKYQNYESDDDALIADMFADFFSSTYSDTFYDSTSSYPYKISSGLIINFPEIECAEVELELRRLKVSYNHGPDGIPNCILRYCAASLSKPLTLIFNASIKYGYVPSKWKSSYIIPLFKSGCKSHIKNYRGIAKLSSIPKLLEKFITLYLNHNLSHLISQSQHGFKKGCSTATNLLQLTTLINRGFLKNKQTDVIYTDFSKAFDRVNHKLLLNKLDMLGFSPNSLKWIKSYLYDRNQKVLFKMCKSKLINVPSGVPQGSHLGPIFFSLFINDLPNILEYSNVLMFADDVKLFLTYNRESDHLRLQHDLDTFYTWCSINLMELNMNKCKHMRFFRNSFIGVNFALGGQPLELVSSFLDLGIMVDVKLSFVPHINMMVNKARGVLAFIKRWAKEFTDPYITKLLFTSLVRPILEYGSVVWDPYYSVHSDHIESIQKQFLLFCLRGMGWNPAIKLPPYHQRLMLINLPSLKSRRIMLNVSFVLNIVRGDLSSEFLLGNILLNVPQRPTRYFQPIAINSFRTNYANADPLRRICANFNELYQFIDYSSNLNIIKHNIIIFLNC